MDDHRAELPPLIESGVSLLWGCRTIDDVADRIVGILNEQPDRLVDLMEEELLGNASTLQGAAHSFGGWKATWVKILPSGEAELLEAVSLPRVLERAAIRKRAWLEARRVGIGDPDWGTAGIDDRGRLVRVDATAVRKRLVRLIAADLGVTEIIQGGLDDYHGRTLSEPPLGRDAHAGLWAGDRGRDGHRRRT